MICERCGEVGETFMTERHGELCAACQRLVEEQEQPPRPPPRDRAGGAEG